MAKDYKILLEDRSCIVKDSEGKGIIKVHMESKCFALNMLKDKVGDPQVAMQKPKTINEQKTQLVCEEDQTLRSCGWDGKEDKKVEFQ